MTRTPEIPPSHEVSDKQMMFVTLAEIRRCIDDGRLDVAQRKLLAIETNLKSFRHSAQEWQDIQTAPKNHTIVLLYGLENHREVWGRGYYFKGVPGDGEGWITSVFYSAPKDDMRGSFTPSHWMPIPDPPKAASLLPADCQRTLPA